MEANEIMEGMTARYGKNLSQRMKKLNEEIRELHNAIAFSGSESILDELADVQVIVAHMAHLMGTTPQELINSAWNKILRRDTDPTYKHSQTGSTPRQLDISDVI